MTNKYTDEQLLNAIEKWRKTISEKLIAEKNRKKIHESLPINNILKNIKKEFKKQSKNTNNDWNIIWNKVVGDEIKSFTQVKRWHNGFLEVIVENPTLRSELDAFFKESLIVSIREIIDNKKLLRGIKFISN